MTERQTLTPLYDVLAKSADCIDRAIDMGMRARFDGKDCIPPFKDETLRRVWIEGWTQINGVLNRGR